MQDDVLAARDEAALFPEHTHHRVGEEQGGRNDVDEEGMAVQGGLVKEGDEFRLEEDGKSDHPCHNGQKACQHIFVLHGRPLEHSIRHFSITGTGLQDSVHHNHDPQLSHPGDQRVVIGARGSTTSSRDEGLYPGQPACSPPILEVP